MRFYNNIIHNICLFGKYDLTPDKTNATVELLVMHIYNIQHQIKRETKANYTPKLS